MEFKLKTLKTEIDINKIANVHFFEFKKNFFSVKDKHPFCELVFVSSGKLNIESQDFTGSLFKNQMIIHRADTVHSLNCSPQNAPIVIIIGFVCDSKNLNYFSYNPVTLNEVEIQKLAEVVKEGRNVFLPPFNRPTYDMKKKKKQPFGAEQLLKISLEYFLLSLIQKYGKTLQNDAANNSYSLHSINEIISYVDENYLEKITIDELAFLFKTNRTTLCHEFKKATNKTVIQYINDKKIMLAIQKIKNSDYTFTEIADQLNFKSIHYFTLFFKKQLGMPPKEYKRSLSKNTL